MGYPTKIATCCYCGSRAALVLDRNRHELTCANCGAPLHDMKRLRTEPAPEPAPQVRPHHHQPAQRPQPKAYAQARRKPGKKRKSFARFLLKEAFDVIEDIFD